MQLSFEIKKAIENNAFCAIATQLGNGKIQNHLMWVDYKDDAVLINTEKGRKKTSNIRENNLITLVIFEPSAMYSSCHNVRRLCSFMLATDTDLAENR